MVGRLTKYTPERAEKLLQALRVGATRRLACQYAGISEDTFARWLRGQRGAPAEMADRVNEAEAAAAITWLAVIEKASVTTWQAAAWKLERRYPREYGRTVQEVDLRTLVEREAERVAEERGLPKRELLAEIDRMIREEPA